MKTYSHFVSPVLPMFITHMFIVIAAGLFGISVIPHGIFWDQQLHHHSWLLDMFSRWDTGWYYGIAVNGYSESATPFFPLFPIILSLLPATASSMILGGFIISLLGFLAALVFLRLFILKIDEEETANRTLWIVSLFPGSIFLTAVYPMSLFLLFIILFFLGIVTKRYVLSFVAGFLAALSWNSGFVLAFSGLYVVIQSYRKEGLQSVWKKSLTVIGPASALGFYAIYLWAKFGTPFTAMIALREHFKNEMTLPVWNHLKMLWTILNNQEFPLLAPLENAKYIYLLDIFTSFAALLLIIIMIIKKMMVYTLPYLIVALFMLLSNAPSGIMSSSATRYLCVLFPLWIMLARCLNNKNQYIAALVISTSLMILNMILFAGGYWMT